MSTNANPTVLNPVNVNDDLTKALQGALDPSEIRAAVIAEAEKQTAATRTAEGQAAAEKAAADKAAADAAAAEAANKNFTRVETIGGKDFTFEAGSELELERMVSNAYKVAYAVQPTNEPQESPEDKAAMAEAARLAAEAAAANKADLELKFKRGDISAAEYLEQSGAVDEYLTNHGVPLSALQAAVNQNESAQETQSWADATQAFLNGPAGSDWPGGDKNLKIIGMIIASKPELMNATDKVAALAQAYGEMKSQGTVFDYTPPAAAPAAAPAAPVVAAAPAAPAAPAAAPVAPKTPNTSSSLFGQSSGVGGSGAPAAPAAGAVDVPANASPAEILEAWKKAQVANGKDPNAAFLDAFRSRSV